MRASRLFLAAAACISAAACCGLAVGDGAEGKAVRPVTAAARITVSSRPWGVSTRYIGGTEGNMRFSVADLVDCGINTLRVYGDMSRFEPMDDDGVYGSPTIAEIKADPSRIPWKQWDAIMDGPYSSHTPSVTWRDFFADLKRAQVCVVLSLRNRDAPTLNPKWMAAVPQSEADWNEWWAYVFAMAYWLNVRNDFGVDEYEVLNEPDNTPQQGWLGTQEQYYAMVRRTKEALDFVYHTYLPGRTYHVHAPVTSGPAWVEGTLAHVGDCFDSLNVHNYAWWDKGELARKLHGQLSLSGHADYPIWYSEWGTYDAPYDAVWMGLALVESLIRYSQPAENHVYGSHVFSFYDWEYEGKGQWGLVAGDGTRRHAYYALRLACRALAGAKPTHEAITDSGDLLAIATEEADGRLNLLVLNWGEKASYVVTADLSGLLSKGTAALRQFSAEIGDRVVGTTRVTDGHARFAVPPWSAVLVTCRGTVRTP